MSDNLIGWYSEKQAERTMSLPPIRGKKMSGFSVYTKPDGSEATVTEVRLESDGPSNWPDATRVGVVVSWLREA